MLLICGIYPLPVTDSHLWYTTQPDIRQYSHKCSHVARFQKHKYSLWNFVATSLSWGTRYFICTSDSRPPSLISHSIRLTQSSRVGWHRKHRYDARIYYVWCSRKHSDSCWGHAMYGLDLSRSRAPWSTQYLCWSLLQTLALNGKNIFAVLCEWLTPLTTFINW